MSMFEDHKKTIRKYDTGREEILKIVKDLISKVGTRESARRLNMHPQYLDSIKNVNGRSVSYKKLVGIAEKLSEVAET